MADLIRNIRRYHDIVGPYHTAGNPGRGELDDSQEINYPAVIRAIMDTGFQGFIAQEFIPPPRTRSHHCNRPLICVTSERGEPELDPTVSKSLKEIVTRPYPALPRPSPADLEPFGGSLEPGLGSGSLIKRQFSTRLT